MADNRSIKDINKDLKNQQEQLKALKKLGEEITSEQKNQIRNLERQISQNERIKEQKLNKIKLDKLEAREFSSFAKKYKQFGLDVQKQLSGTSKSGSLYLDLGREIAAQKKIQAKYAESEKQSEQELAARAAERENAFSDAAQSLAEQAKATQKAEDDLRGISEVERKIKDIKESQGIYNAIQKKKLIETLQLTEQLRLKEERLKQIKEEQQSLYEALPDSMQQGLGFAKKLFDSVKNGAVAFVLISGLLLAGISAFTKLDDAAAEFRETTGLTNSQMEGIRSNANEIAGTFGELGVDAKGVMDTAAALKTSLGDSAQFSKETLAALTVLGKNFGITAENVGKVQGVFEQVGGLSAETAANVGMQAANMAKVAGVAPAKVFEDIAESAEAASTLFRGDINLLAKNAVEARRLGTNLKEVTKTAERLLDFEGSIEDELVAATFVGGQFNLSRARALAMEGKLVDAQKETLAQIQRSGDFRKQDYFTQKQLAKAAGMSVEEINKQLNAQEKLSSLSAEQRKAAEEAINAGLDITNISADQLASETEKFKVQQENQKQMDKLSNAFTSIAATVGSVITPLLEAVIPIVQTILIPIQFVANLFKEIVGNMFILLPMLAAMGIYLAVAKKEAIQLAFANLRGAITGIFKSFAQIPLGIGIPLAIGAVAGLVTMFSKFNKAGDIDSPADGTTRVSTKEGGLYELSKNDDLAAGPGISDKLNGGAAGGNLNLAVLSAPLNAMIGELKALRADLAAGKIAVNMDGVKVSSGIGKVVDGSTRNNFAMAQA
jgi:transcriptional regulator with XRE-family HTH domain